MTNVLFYPSKNRFSNRASGGVISLTTSWFWGLHIRRSAFSFLDLGEMPIWPKNTVITDCRCDTTNDWKGKCQKGIARKTLPGSLHYRLENNNQFYLLTAIFYRKELNEEEDRVWEDNKWTTEKCNQKFKVHLAKVVEGSVVLPSFINGYLLDLLEGLLFSLLWLDTKASKI